MRPGRNPEKEARRLRRAFERVTSRLDRAGRRRRVIRRLPALVIAAVFAMGLVAVLETYAPWPPLLVVRHIATALGCTTARLVRLAPARRGQPGYWPWLDADGDGIACEPLPR